MRISNPAFYKTLNDNLQSNLGRLQSIQARISAGGGIINPSEDPLAYAYNTRFKDSISQIEKYESDSSLYATDMSLYEVSLTKASDILRSVRTIALRANNANVSTDELNNMGTEVNTYIQEMLGVSNTNLQGKYLFSGTSSSTSSFESTKNGDEIMSVKYQGNSSTLHREIGFNETIKVNYNGVEVFQNPAQADGDIFQTLIDLKKNIRDGNTQEIGNSLTKIEGSIDHVLGYRADVGHKVAHLENLSTVWSRMKLRLSENSDKIGVQDMAELILNLNAQNLSYQASVKMAATFNEVSLLNYMR